MADRDSQAQAVDDGLVVAAGDGGAAAIAASPPAETAPAAPVLPRRRLNTFDSLRDSNYRWFFGSMFAGFTGMSIQMFIAGWLVYQLTESFAALGTMSLAQGLANLALSLFGGALADRVRRKQTIVQAGQAISAVVALVMAVLIATGALTFVHVVIAAAMLGGAHAFTMPARQSLTPDVVGMERLTNAMALYTFGQNSATLLMPGIAGWVVAALGSGTGVDGAQYVYGMMALIYLTAAVLLVRVRTAPNRSRAGRAVLRELVEGFQYVRRTTELRLLLTYNVAIALFAMAYMSLLPGFADEVLGVKAGKLGLLQSVTGVGAVVGSLVVASLPPRRRGLLLLMSVLFLGGALLAFAISEVYWLSLGIVVLVGFGQAGYLTLSNVLLQAYVEQEYRGRVLSIYLMQFGLMSIGIFGIGVFADIAGPQVAIGTSAFTLIAITVSQLFVPAYRAMD